MAPNVTLADFCVNQHCSPAVAASLFRYHRACLEYLQYVDQSNGDLNTDEIKDADGAVMYLERIQQVVWNRKFFLKNPKNKDGDALYGLGPSSAWRYCLHVASRGCLVGSLVCGQWFRESI